MSEAPLPPEQQEALFQDIIRKMSSANEPAKLEELALLALNLMLRRGDDPKGIRDKLSQQIKAITSAVKSGQQPDITRKAMVVAAKGCIQVLKAAKAERPPRPPEPVAEVEAPQPKSGDEDVDHTGKILLGAVVAMALLTVGAGLVVWRHMPARPPVPPVAEQQSSETSPPAAEETEAGKFVDQLLRVAGGASPPAMHMFGGAVEVNSVLGGNHIVTARDVPAQICSEAGMILAGKGLLSINGQTLAIVTQDGLTELCRLKGETAFLTWAPR